MNYALETSRRVDQDIAGGWAFFEERQNGLGDRLIREIYATFDRLLENPFLFQERYRGCRFAFTARFKYKVIYQIRGEVVRVVAVQHPRQDPDSWRDRL